MEAEVYIKIDENGYIEGSIHYQNVDIKNQEVIFNQGYQLFIDHQELNHREGYNQEFCTEKVVLHHQGSFSLNFKGDIEVPQHHALVKKEGYLEVNGNCGVIPLIEGYKRCDFHIHACIPPDYCLAGFKKNKEYYELSIFDNIHVVFVMFKKEQMRIYNENHITIYASNNHGLDQIQQMAKQCDKICQVYNKWFSHHEFKDLYIILNPRFEDGAYAVNHIICLVDRIEGLTVDTFMHLAHEISHLWWKNAKLNFHENWLNESFAQYSALSLVREYYGYDEYQKILNDFQKKSKNLPSLFSLSNETPKDIMFDVCYSKVPYLLTQLENEIGFEKMLNLFYQTYQKRVKTTEEFLKLCPEFIKYGKQ